MSLTISQRAQNMPESPIRKLMPSADIAIEKGLQVYQLNIGQPDIKSPSAAIKALHHWEEETLSYTRSEGEFEYRKNFAKYYQSVGYNIEAEDILATNGGSEALLFTISAIAEPGEEIIVPEPFYANYNGFASQLDVKLIPVSSCIETGFVLPPIEEFENKITPKTRAILICHPGNPTGYLYKREELEALKNLVLKHHIYLISDEVYREFAYDRKHFSILDFPEIRENAIVIDSESKRFSMCGIRLGAIITKNETVLSAALKFAQARLSPNIISQHIASAAHKNSGEYLKEANLKYRKRRDFTVKILNQIEGVICPEPQGAFYCVARLPIDDSERFAKWILEEFSWEGATTMIAPMQGFYSTPGKGVDEVRIAYVLDLEHLEKALKILEEALKVYPGRK